MLEADDRATPRGFEDLPLFATPPRPAAPDPRQAALEALVADARLRPPRRAVAPGGARGAVRAQAEGSRRALAAAARPSARCARLRAKRHTRGRRHDDHPRPFRPARLPAREPAGARAILSRSHRHHRRDLRRRRADRRADARGRPAAVADVEPEHRRREPRRRRPQLRGDRRGGAEHDGYTLLASETGFVTSQPHLYAKGKLPYDPETDFIPVAGYAGIPVALLVDPSVPVEVGRRVDRARQGRSPAPSPTAPPASAPPCTPARCCWKASPASSSPPCTTAAPRPR